MISKAHALAWLHQRAKNYDSKAGLSEVVEDFDEVGKLGQGFASVDDLVEVNVGQGNDSRPTFISANLQGDQRGRMCEMLWELSDCFVWNYTKMPGLSRELVEHTLPIKRGFRPYKQPMRNYNVDLLDKIKEEVEHLLQANFIRACRYAE
jgi:hypothetical protein